MTRVQYGISTLLGALCLAVLGANVTLALLNKLAQGEVAMRQQYVQQSVQLEGLYREIVRALAELGARNNDEGVRAMLQRHGISYSVNAAATANAPSGAATPGNVVRK